MIFCAVPRASVLIVSAAQAAVVWSADWDSSAGVAALEYSANHQLVGVPAAVPPEMNVRLVTRSPACRKSGTDVITCVVSASARSSSGNRGRFARLNTCVGSTGGAE